MKRWITPLAVVAGTAVMLACANGQEAPTTAQDAAQSSSGKQAPKTATKKQKPAAEKKDAQADQSAKDDAKKSDASDDSEAKPLLNTLDLAYTTWSSTRNINTIHRNGYVQGGFGIADLKILEPFETDHLMWFDFKGNPSNDYGTRLVTQWGDGTTLKAGAGEFSYYEPSFGTNLPSQDKSWDVSIDRQLAPNFGAFVAYRYDESQHHFPAPYAQPNYNNSTASFGIQKGMGDTTIGVTLSENRFSDLLQIQPNTLTDRGEMRLSNTSGNLSTQAVAATTMIQQPGEQKSFIRDYGLSGIYDVSENSNLAAQWHEQILDLNSVQNAYVRKKVSTGATYDLRLGNWGAALGFQHREEERVRADHSFVDVPKWNTWDFKLTGRLAKAYRVSLKSTIEDLTTSPVFLTDDPSLLYWSRKETVAAKISTGNTINTGYFTYTYRYRQNNDRGLSVNWYNFALGGSRVFSPKLLGYAEFASDQYNSGGQSAQDSAIGSYFPSSETFMFGLDYTRNSRENLSLVLSSFYTQDEWGQQVAVTYHLDWGKERNLQITYSPWLQRDRLYDVDTFDAPILQVKVGTRF
ncbi:MAG: acid shock protein [Fimbriimonas sp.]|nr:acid shock protein [Fimbriimonas sp.]